MKLRFWGVRGSIPTPGPDTAGFGGNTACYEIIGDCGTRLIFDAGTGIRVLGNSLPKDEPITAHLFISHTHWDHIQGFPFFVPAFIAGNHINIYGPALQERSLEGAMRIQMDYTFFPVREAELKATLNYRSLREEEVKIGNISVRCKFTNHPVLTLSFRISDGKHTIVYTGDTEPYYNVLRFHSAADEGAEVDPEELREIDDEVDYQNQRHIDFCAGADVLIHDAQYTSPEYKALRRGWGHSPMDHVVDVGRRAGVRHLIMTSHDPLSTDKTLSKLEAAYRVVEPQGGPHISFAREGMEINLHEAAEPNTWEQESKLAS